MNCHCQSKNLYRNFAALKFTIDKQELSQSRAIEKQGESSLLVLEASKMILEKSSIYLPSTAIDRISIEEIYSNPIWFYKNYIALNKPCIIADSSDIADICETWSNQKQFLQIVKEVGNVSISLTPDGFADSIKNEYFIEPASVQAPVSELIKWKNEDQGIICQNWIPYIQQQNSNLTQEFGALNKSIKNQVKQFLSQKYFDGQPDASNFWMGYQQSVSALHKDPYENFYSVIAGEKHFTLMPPASILFLQQNEYRSAAWKINNQNQMAAETNENSMYPTTRWISNNPDLLEDYEMFPMMQHLKQMTLHVVVEAGEMLYLPSLWYHQVAQTHKKAPYTMAINYWYDMNFGPNYTLYEAARKLRNYT